MQIQPTITFEQYRDTCRAVLAAKTKRVRHRSWIEYLVLGIVSLALGLAFLDPISRVPAITIYGVMILCWILNKPLAKRSQVRCLRAMFAEEQESLGGQVLTIDESGISCDRFNGQATSHHSWRAFIKLIDMPDAFLFLPTPNQFIRLPKELLAAADRELVLQWSSTVPKHQKS